MSKKGHTDQRSTAVWYFVGATFLFVLPNQLFTDSDGWVRTVFIVFGIVAMAAGFAQMRREFAGRRRAARSGDGASRPAA